MWHFFARRVGVLLLISMMASPVCAENCEKAARLNDEAQSLLDSKPSQALVTMREAVALCSKSASLQHNYGVALSIAGQGREAEAAFEEALKLKPDYAKAMASLAALLYEQGGEREYQKAVLLIRKAALTDPQNRQIRAISDQIAASVDAPSQTAALNRDAIAVIIGNKTYRNGTIPAVEYADRDATIMKKYLVDVFGFRDDNVLLMRDANYTDLLKMFGDAEDHKGRLYNLVREHKSDVFIFYSGHGAPDTNTHRAYIAPVDLDPYAVKHSAYSLDLLYENLAKLSKEKAPKSLTVVIDACFSGSSERGMIIKNASPISIEVSNPVLALRDATIFTSSQGNQISSWYPAQRHGLFTYFFLKSIKDAAEKGVQITTGEIANRLGGPDGVNDVALRLYSRQQQPQIIGNRNSVLLQ